MSEMPNKKITKICESGGQPLSKMKKNNPHFFLFN